MRLLSTFEIMQTDDQVEKPRHYFSFHIKLLILTYSFMDTNLCLNLV